MREVFADAFNFFARINSRDQSPSKVLLFKPSSATRLVTTEWISLEVADGFSNSRLRAHVTEIIRDLREGEASVVMKARSLRDALASDHPFERAGLHALLT